jgi:hypothetical protein
MLLRALVVKLLGFKLRAKAISPSSGKTNPETKYGNREIKYGNR